MTISARESVLAALPEKTLSLIADIERFAGLQIGFRDMTILRQAGGKDTDVEFLYVDHEKAYVAVPDLQSVDAMAVTHELLHLRRYWIGQIPLLEAKSYGFGKVEMATGIDNCLEHLIVVPQEREFGFDTNPFWTETMKTHWQLFPWPQLPAMGRRYAALTGWLTMSLIEDAALVSSVRDKLLSIDLLGEADRFQTRATSLLGQKPRLVSAALRFLKIPAAEMDLVVMDIRNRRRILFPVPAQ